MATAIFFSVAIQKNARWRTTCFLLFCATRRERTRLVLVCERLGRRNNAALLTSAVANKPLREEATFIYKDSSQKADFVRPTEHLKIAGQLQC